MTPARFQTIEEIFLAALEQEPDQVSAFLDAACKGDAVLRREVETLLASDQRAGRFIEGSTVGLATKIIEDRQAHSLVGQTIGHYKISESIGSGGMGEVYLATDIVAGRRAALKLLPLRFTGDAARLKRFQQEARAVVGLNHPNVLTVYEIGEDHSIHYIASELIEGETLRERLTRGPMRLNEAVDIAIQVASALAAAHEAGIVHRDIKPENIMLRRDGYVKVLDFGIAKLAEEEVPPTMPREEALLLVETNLGSILGTARYMSPEQACGAHVDSRTDIWSLGVVLYEMVTGHTPFTGDTPQEVMSAILEKEPPPLARYVKRAPAELQQIINKTLRKDCVHRYHNAHELLQALKGLRHKLEVEVELERAAAPLWLRWARSPVAVVLALLVAVLALALPFYRYRNLTTTPPPEKSIAVLPLENLSAEKENAFFADGIHDELLSNLSKIADLKVISRTSVVQYKSGNPRNVREIGQQLGVAHVLEGTVQRTGNRVKVSAQLIDARTDAHVWSQTYDRDLVDVFAIQSEIAKTIADQLQAKLSPAEKTAIGERPSADPVAYAYYTRARESGLSVKESVELLEKATQRDPNFALAYCALSKAQIDLQDDTVDPEQKYLESAKKAAEAALRLRPDLGEPHLALARYYAWVGVGTSDYDKALEELAIARRMLPNNAEALAIEAKIGRHQSRWDVSLANLQKANELDPLNGEIVYGLWQIYFEMRRYSEAEQLLTKETAISKTEDSWIKALLAELKVAQGDPVAAQSLLEQIPLDFNPTADTWDTRFKAALYRRDYDAANRMIAAAPEQVHPFDGPPDWANGQVARARGDQQTALAAFGAARKKDDAWYDRYKGYNPDGSASGYIGERGAHLAGVARFDAGLGRKEEAIREAQRAVEVVPIAKDSLNGPTWVAYLALVYAWTGERERALEQLETVATIPNGPTYGDLRFNPCWDDLRGDPRFDKIVGAAKAASRYALEPLPEKSIAVLPFENLSKDQENAFFAAGVQDEILTNLAKIADLKVISRTSVMRYKSGLERNLREIAKTLSVSYVLEGSVQRAGDRVRVSAQLIDARNDTHVWAEHYDRDVADVFAVQTEIAQQIADQLKVNLSPGEKAAIAAPPTADLVAYTYYAKANQIDIYGNWEGGENEKSAKQKVELLEKATQRDPNFVLAYCALAQAQLDLGNFELAKKAAETALRLRPDLVEPHLAIARYCWLAPDSIVDADANRKAYYDRARDELAIVRRISPNNAEALLIDATIGRHQNRWAASLANLRRANELDPQNGEIGYRLEQIYFEMRHYSELEQFIRNQAPPRGALQDPFNWLALAKLAQGDRAAAQALLEQVPPEYSSGAWIWGARFKTALYQRDYDAANRVIAATPADYADDAFGGPSNWAEGLVARARGDKQRALAAFAAARQKMEAQLRDKPKDASYFADIAKLDAGLGRKEEAISAAQRAVELQPITRDSLNGPYWVANLALVYAWTGERDRALEQLEKVATIPGNPEVPTCGDLLFNPRWDDLRGDPRFDKIVAAAKAAMK